jgi:hypothetical protein
MVKIVPINYPEPDSWLRCMRDKEKIVGDIVSPAENAEKWKVFSE